MNPPSMNAAGQASFCANHPDRPGRAVCMSCKKVVCQECATQWEGIHYCVACLAARRTKAVERSSPLGWAATAAAAAMLFWIGLRLMVWAGAILAELL